MSTSEEYSGVEYPAIILVDSMLQFLFQGIILAQSLSYWRRYRDDSRILRVYVAILVSLSLVQTALQGFKAWRTTIYAESWSTSTIQWSDVLLNSIICSLAQAFYIRRCWKFTGRRPCVLMPLSVFSLSTLAASIYLAVASQRVAQSESVYDEDLDAGRYLQPSTIVAFTYWIFASLTLDITVTSILILHLWRSRTGLAQSDRVVGHIIAITWEAAVPPSLFMLVAGCLYHSVPNPFNHLAVFFTILTGKLYTLGLLRLLNCRINLRARMQSQDLGRRSLTNWQWERETTQADPGSDDPSRHISAACNTTMRSSFASSAGPLDTTEVVQTISGANNPY